MHPRGDLTPCFTRISSLIATPLSGVLGLGFQGGVETGQAVMNSINQGLLRGITNFAINYAGEELGLNPLLTSLSATALGGAISDLFGFSQVDPMDPDHLIKPANMFEGIANAFMRGLSSTLTFGGVGNDSWSQAAQLQRITSFSDLARQMGLSKAIDTYATSIFQQTAIEQMVQISGSVQQYIEDQIKNKNYIVKVEDGQEYKYILVPGSEGEDPYSNDLDTAYVKVDTTVGHEGVYGMASEGYMVDGEFDVMSDNGLGLSVGSLETIYEGSRYIQKWYGGQAEYTNVISLDGYMGTFYSDLDAPTLMIANQGELFDGVFTDVSGS